MILLLFFLTSETELYNSNPHLFRIKNASQHYWSR